MSYGQQPYGNQPYGGQYGQNPYAQPQSPYPQPNPYPQQPQQHPGYGYGQPAVTPQPPQPQQPQQPQQPPASQPSPALQTPVPAPAPRKAPMAEHAVPCVTLDAIPGREIASVVGEAIGVVVRPKVAGSDLNITLTEARQEAVEAAAQMAAGAGAEAVVSLRFETSLLDSAASAEIVAYGTAVTLVPLPADE